MSDRITEHEARPSSWQVALAADRCKALKGKRNAFTCMLRLVEAELRANASSSPFHNLAAGCTAHAHALTSKGEKHGRNRSEEMGRHARHVPDPTPTITTQPTTHTRYSMPSNPVLSWYGTSPTTPNDVHVFQCYYQRRDRRSREETGTLQISESSAKKRTRVIA